MRGRNAALSCVSVAGARVARIERTERRAGARRAVGVQRVLPAHRARALVQQLAFRVRDRQQRAELAVRERVADQECSPRVKGVADVVVCALRAGDDREAVVVERSSGAQIDGGAERAFLGFRGGRLVDRDRVEQFGSERVEVEGAVAVGATRRVGAAVRAHRFHAVDAHARELRPEAAHADLPAFAGVTCDRYPRHALNRFGEVQIGEVGDVFGEDRIDRVVGSALHVERRTEALPESGHDDLVGPASFLRGGRPGHRRHRRHCEDGPHRRGARDRRCRKEARPAKHGRGCRYSFPEHFSIPLLLLFICRCGRLIGLCGDKCDRRVCC